MNAHEPDTVALVPLKELIDFALLVHAMMRAQERLDNARTQLPHARTDADQRAVNDHRRRVAATVRQVLAREQQTLPGMNREAG